MTGKSSLLTKKEAERGNWELGNRDWGIYLFSCQREKLSSEAKVTQRI
jgi:hypothetical protein